MIRYIKVTFIRAKIAYYNNKTWRNYFCHCYILKNPLIPGRIGWCSLLGSHSVVVNSLCVVATMVHRNFVLGPFLYVVLSYLVFSIILLGKRKLISLLVFCFYLPVCVLFLYLKLFL